MRSRKSPIPIIAAVLLLVVVGYYFYTTGKISETVNQQIPMIKDVFTNTRGQVIGSISFIKPPTPPPINQLQAAQMNQITQNQMTVANESTTTQNTTKKLNSTISVTSQQVSYGSASAGTANLQGNYISATTDSPTWTLGNKVVIGGIIQIVDPSTLNQTNPRIIPPPYQYHLNISCQFRGCDMDDIGVTNGLTDSGGGFSYSWTTSTVTNSAGQYVATVTALSFATQNGIPYQMTSNYYFNLINP